jgi:hypothetical protein
MPHDAVSRKDVDRATRDFINLLYKHHLLILEMYDDRRDVRYRVSDVDRWSILRELSLDEINGANNVGAEAARCGEQQ